MALEKSHRKPAMVKHPRLWWSRARRSWPFFVWLAVVIVSLNFYSSHSRFWGITGAIQSRVELVAPLETARLKSINVIVGERVKAGQVIAQMDTSVLDAEIAVDEARIMEAESSIAGYQQNMLQIVRQFETAKNNTEVALERTRSEWEQAKQELAELEKELEYREDLLAKKLIQSSDLYQLRAGVASLKASMEGFEEMERIHEEAVKRAHEEREELQKALKVEEGESVAVAIAKKMESRQLILETAREQRMNERERYTLRASRDSVVSRVYAREGDVIRAGTDVARLVGETSDIIEGFLPETHVAEIVSGQKLRVLARNGRSKFTAEVLSIAPEIQTLPGRATPIANQQVRGRRILLQLLEDNHGMLPGETVKIRPLPKGLFGKNIEESK